MLFSINQRFVYTRSHNIALLKTTWGCYVFKTSSIRRWEIIVDCFEQLTDTLHNKKALSTTLKFWMTFPWMRKEAKDMFRRLQVKVPVSDYFKN